MMKIITTDATQFNNMIIILIVNVVAVRIFVL